MLCIMGLRAIHKRGITACWLAMPSGALIRQVTMSCFMMAAIALR